MNLLHRMEILDAEKKEAYRHLLYCALLELRTGRRLPGSWNPLDWLHAVSRHPRHQLLADDFHNLAFFCREDFRGFDEERFWNGLTGETGAKYRRIFEGYLRGEHPLA